jgi:hypothetical protein
MHILWGSRSGAISLKTVALYNNLLHWSRAWGFTSISSILDFISSLSVITHTSAYVNS